MLSVTVPALPAQTIEDRMNAILLDESMLSGYGEGEMEQEAYQNALQELASTVTVYRLEHGSTPVSTGDVQIRAKSISQPDGRVVLLYLTVKEALAIVPRDGDGSQIAVDDTQQPQPQEPQSQSQPQPIPQQPSQPQPQSPSHPQQQPPSQSSVNTPLPVAASSGAGEVAELIAAYSPLQLDELSRILTHNKELGKVAEFGQAGRDRTVPPGAYVVIVGRDYGVKAVLSPRDANPRLNLITGNTDNETNYHDYGIIWFR